MEEFGGFQTKEQLVAYLKHAISLETDVATQEMIVQECERDTESRKPMLVEQTEPERPMEPAPKEALETSLNMNEHPYICVSTILAGSIGFLLLFLPFSATLLLIGILCLFPLILERNYIHQKYKKSLESYHESLQFYEEQLAKVQEHNNILTEEYHKRLAEWQRSASDNKTTLEAHLRQTRELLEKLYALDHIYPKYRNLPALTSIYEYFITGRCSSLIGPHGAYNMFEDEVRKDIIISQLNTVIENLDQIKRNQYMLYEQVTQIQRNTHSIEQELKQVKGLTVSLVQLSSLTAYYAAVTARNTEITAAYHILNG